MQSETLKKKANALFLNEKHSWQKEKKHLAHLHKQMKQAAY